MNSPSGGELALRRRHGERRLVQVDDLVEVGDERVRQDDDRRARLLRRVEGIDRDAERLLHAVRVEGDRRVVAGAAPLDLHDVALARHGRHPGRRADAHDVHEHARHADLLRVADRLLHEAEARTGGGGEGLRARQGGADDRVRRRDLVLRLQEAELGVLRGPAGGDVQDLGRRADRVAGVVAGAGGEGAAEDRLVALRQLACHGTAMIATGSLTAPWPRARRRRPGSSRSPDRGSTARTARRGCSSPPR